MILSVVLALGAVVTRAGLTRTIWERILAAVTGAVAVVLLIQRL
jgi:hypothetical protein